MLITDLIVSILFYFLIFLTCFTFGEFFLKLVDLNFKELNSDKNFIKPVIGFSIISITSYFFYFNLNFTPKNISIFFLILFLSLFTYLIIKANFLRNILKTLIPTLPIFFIFILYGLINGEQFYIFRGNYWDNMNYISSAILIKDMNFESILKLKDNYNFGYIIENGSKNILFRPLISLLLSLVFVYEIKDIFFSTYFFKVFLLILTYLSFNYLAFQLKIKNTVILSYVFIFSFWTLYIFEIEALSHLGSLAIFLSVISLYVNEKRLFFLKNTDLIVFITLILSLFFIYPELFVALSVIYIIFISLHKNLLSKIKFQKKNFFIIVISFFILSSPTYLTNYYSTILQIKFATFSKPDWWGYYGLFLLGNVIEIISEENISFIKNIFKEDPTIFMDLIFLKDFFIKQGVYIVPINIIPSFFGLYFYTTGNYSNYFDIIFIAITFLLNLYLIKIIINNCREIFNYKKDNINKIFFSFFIGFFIFAAFFILRSNFWGLIKLYTFVSPLIFLFIAIKLKNRKRYISLNIPILFFLIIFPIYKYSDFNSGIGRYDTFPSIINPKYKLNYNWNSNIKEITSCKNIRLTSQDKIINSYISIKLYNLGFLNINKKNFTNINIDDLNKAKLNCKINLDKSGYKLIYD